MNTFVIEAASWLKTALENGKDADAQDAVRETIAKLGDCAIVREARRLNSYQTYRNDMYGKIEDATLALLMLDWHSGGGSAVYAVGSSLFAGRVDVLANTELVDRAKKELNEDEGSKYLANKLEYRSWLYKFNQRVLQND